ncbi:DUF5058 family protein [Halanaerobium sp. MA284_MarDTE_T2]|uniref:DUF5058 family protein n=1 Tax=Halanaerobium sp. MA284_MarDTE_T2 TaxID=2183913 RepID=UPI000DF2D8CA|nr:DUF5058 family protein [Halanaerobium sp. MA284_MarDTE_T2]RCW47759.1 uncharacterized protein DUF5058 [Halanaerobium sp. MA284_MarDTE_T2]
MDQVLKVANEWGVWLAAAPVVIIALVQALLYYRQSMKVGQEIGLTKPELHKAFKTGVVTSIGPVIAVFIVMVGLMSVIGGPMAWMRLSVIGAAPTELTAARLGADAAGVEFGGDGYNLEVMAVSWWNMIINGVGWLLFVGLFAHKLEDVREKVANGDSRWLGVLSGAAMLGVFGYLNADYVLSLGGPLVAVVVGALSMVALLKISESFRPIKEYSLGIAMLLGMFFATLLG